MANPNTLTALLESGADSDVARLAPERAAVTYGELRRHVSAVAPLTRLCQRGGTRTLMRDAVLAAVRALDHRLAAATLARRRERPALLAFMVHGVFADERDAAASAVDPAHPVTVGDLERFAAYFLELGYQFVTPAQIAAGLDPARHSVWLTFDDGYANNLRALPVLRACDIPATFFVSTNHVADGKAFWWDAVYRGRRRHGVPEAAIRREQAALKARPARAIENYIRAELGAAALDPIGDSDRPLSAAELRVLAAEPLAILGNHTADHALLTQCDDDEVRAQIRTCQRALADASGTAPQAIAYPDGRYDRRVVRLALAEGLRVGAVTERRKNQLPLNDAAVMRIARFSLPPGPSLAADCRLYRSDFRVVSLLRRLQPAQG